MTRLALFVSFLALPACAPAIPSPAILLPAILSPAGPSPAAPASEPTAWFNLAHLDYLGEDVVVDGDTARLVHIYAEAPDWRFVGDDDEGIACVDDVARAAVVYLRHYQTTGSADSRRKAVRLLRFVRHLQAESGLFYNFVWDRALRPNTEHPNSRADDVTWWTARAVWALGVGAETLAASEPDEAAASLAAVRRVEPHLDRLLARHGETAVRPESGDPGRVTGAPFPLWFVAEIGADATSELLLGLVAVERAAPTATGARRVRLFADGLAQTRRGDLNTFPYGGHASWPGSWHGWGNSQTQALSEASRAGLADASALASARGEAETLFAHLLVEGWRHEMDFPTRGTRTFEQIAYAVRTVSVGLIRLYEATGDARYATQAGLAASWLTGNNVAAAVMADPATGRGYDGLQSPTAVNPNAGAESTIEAQFTLLEVERVPEAARWLGAVGGAPVTLVVDGRTLRARTFRSRGGVFAVVVLDPAANRSHVYVGADATDWMARAAHPDRPAAPATPGGALPIFWSPFP